MLIIELSTTHDKLIRVIECPKQPRLPGRRVIMITTMWSRRVAVLGSSCRVMAWRRINVTLLRGLLAEDRP